MREYLALGAARQYETSTEHGQVIARVRQELESRAPGMVEPAETFVTGEGPGVALLIVPHHWLGGISLVVWSESPQIGLRWTALTDLTDHDQMDLGHPVAQWQINGGSDLDQFAATLQHELSRPMTLSWIFQGASANPRGVNASLDLDGKRAKLGVRSQRILWLFHQREILEETSLSSKEPPSFRFPVPLEKLLPQA